MRRTLRHGTLLVVLFAASTGAAAEDRLEAGPLSQKSASLHRVAATLDVVLDVYRLALLEIIPATTKIKEAGADVSATPKTLVPEVAREVFRRLAATVASRVPHDAMSAIARGYHAEVHEALEQLAITEEIGRVLPHLRALAHAVQRFCEHAANIVDLFSRDRPVTAKVMDADTALDDIAAALDELTASEQALVKLRKKDASLDQQLQGFLRLEISLRHALDLIAMAEEAGLQLGFQFRLSTSRFSDQLTRVRSQAVALQGVLADLAQPPGALSGQLRAVRDADGVSARLSWPQQVQLTNLSGKGEDSSRTAALRIYRALDPKGTQERAQAALRCRGEELASPDKAPRLLEEVPTGRVGHTDTVPSDLPARLYAVVPVSPFGVEGAALEAAAVDVPVELRGAPWVAASVQDFSPESPEFYQKAGSVEVSWGRSSNDVRSDARALEVAVELKRPVVRLYRVIRVTRADAKAVGTVYGGTTHFLDRPTLDELRQGVRYSVLAVGPKGAAEPPEDCPASDEVKVDLAPSFGLAAAGMGTLVHPTAIERAQRLRLSERGALDDARRRFNATPADERNVRLSQWWNSVPEKRRILWLQKWTGYMGEEERDAFYGVLPGLARRDEPLIQAEVWLRTQPSVVTHEVERWWDLLDAGRRAGLLEKWWSSLNTEYAVWLRHRVQTGKDGIRFEVERPARVLSWWLARDPMEREALAQWWENLDPVARATAINDWYRQQTEVARRNFRWPDWGKLSDAERDHMLKNGFVILPSGLWHRPLAWLAWNRLEGDELMKAVRSEAGWLGGQLSTIRYALRPLDQALSFRLPVLLFLLLIAGLMGFFLYQSIVKKRAMYLRRIPGIDAIEEAIGRATEMGRPVLYVPGIGEVQEIQTIAGLLILGKVSETIARYDSDLVVANMYPFVQAVAREVVQAGCYDAGRPDLYDPDDVRYVAAEQFPFTAGVNGIMIREKPAAILYMGQFFAESLILAETGFLTGAVQIAGTAEVFQIPFFLAACDYTLIGEELFATSAYLSKEPKLTSTLKAADWVKVAMVAAMTLGVILESTGVTSLTPFFTGY